MSIGKVAKVALRILEAGYKNEALLLLNSQVKEANGTRELKSLISYLSMPEVDRNIELIYSSEFFVRNYSSVVQQTLEDRKTSPKVKQELSNLSDDDYLNDLSEQAITSLEKNMSSKDQEQILDSIMKYEPSEYPLWAAATLNSPTLQKGWLLHSTNNGDKIESNGFVYGVEDMRLLSLTTHLGDAYKSREGFNFAFTPKNYKRYGGKGHYGSDLILFYASYVDIYHHLDEETQAIFWGRDAEHIYQLYEEYGDYTIVLESGEEIEELTLEEVLSVVRKETGKR